MKKVAVLLSGGVDSSVALRLLQDEGHELVAFYLKIWLEDELAYLGNCPWEDDLRYARAVCEDAGVPLEVVSLQREYHDRVVASAVSELRAGRTPSPDILCNRRVKFGAFFEVLEERGQSFDKIASGHYAQVDYRDGRWCLHKGLDPVKDQTYFLYRLDQRQLSKCLFPIGAYPKSASLDQASVRELAAGFDLPNRDRKDSQGICFLGKLPYDEFVRGYLGDHPGEIREVETGRVIGEHRGLWFHTIGQRRGLGLSGGPWYVVGKDQDENVLQVSNQAAMDHHRRDRFRVGQVHWIGELAPPEVASSEDGLQVKIRHGPKVYGCRLQTLGDGEFEVHLAAADPGIAAGQCAVFYRDTECLGGGVIQADNPQGIRI